MLFKAIYYGKEHRKAYHIPAKWNGDFCLSDYSHNPKTQSDWAASNRLHNSLRKIEASRQEINELLGYKPISNKVKNVIIKLAI